MTAWLPHLGILPGAQRDLWPRLDGIPGWFMLYGGTGPALRLGHRPSVDFDLFSDIPFRPDDLAREVPFLAGGRIEQTGANTLVVSVEGVRLSFFGGLDCGVIDSPDRADDGLLVASLLDPAGTRARALMDRTEVEDDRDVDAIPEAGVSLASLLGAFEVLFPGVSPMIVVRSLGHLDDPGLAASPAPVIRRLDRAIARLRTVPTMPTRYPSISAAIAADRPGARPSDAAPISAPMASMNGGSGGRAASR